VLDTLIQKASDTFQELNPGIAEVIARGFRPAFFQKGQSGGAEETALLVMFSGCTVIFLFHVSSPSFPR
jgi:hypothetical protein